MDAEGPPSWPQLLGLRHARAEDGDLIRGFALTLTGRCYLGFSLSRGLWTLSFCRNADHIANGTLCPEDTWIFAFPSLTVDSVLGTDPPASKKYVSTKVCDACIDAYL
ncbi:unnamed protein product [Pipistrellus nathusii]|uniref:Uncharacterized protein n=1 Tax=Pipistrellus nathusii TaxID=59473 RepID=A0ABN9Z643_PIPNA